MEAETIADIVREMRECMPQKMEGFENGELVVLDTAKLADRIEAAYERELVPNRNKLGNAAKMRDALLAVKKLDFYKDEDCYNFYRIINAALAAPPRNCDRYPTFAAAIEAWRDIDPCVAGSFDEWLFAEAEGGAK